MKKGLALICLALFLTGCSAESELELGMAFRDSLLSGNGCCFEASITADYGDELYEFTMDCQGDAQGNVEFCVTSPETISGITGNISEAGGALTFDDTALHFDLLAEEQLSPVSAPWILLKTLRSGYITSVCTEGDSIRLSIDDSYEADALQLDIWLDLQELPARAEIMYDGRRILSVAVANFQIL